MSIREDDPWEQTIDLTQASFGRGREIKVQLLTAMQLAKLDFSNFKAGKAYRVKGQEESAFYINEIVKHHESAMPEACGFLCVPGALKPLRVLLTELGGEVFFAPLR
ncbi:hypothetical protein D3C76_26090 [compost metagenome]